MSEKLAAKSGPNSEQHKYYNEEKSILLDELAKQHPLVNLGFRIYNADSGASVVTFGSDQNIGLVLRAVKNRFDVRDGLVEFGREWVTPDDVEQLRLYKPTTQETQLIAQDVLDSLRYGVIPDEMTRGTELEGAMYEWNEEIQQYVPASVTNSKHPELLMGTWEESISENFPVTPQGYLKRTAEIYLQACDANQDKLYVLSDVVEGGNLSNAKENDSSYVQLMIGLLKGVILEQESLIPEDSRALYASLFNVAGVKNFDEFFQKHGLLWPSQGQHDHLGIPLVKQDQRIGDASIGLSMRNMLHTKANSLISLLTGSSERMYGNFVNTAFPDKDMAVVSVRSIIKRMFATARGGKPFSNYHETNKAMINAILNGDIHSVSRFPSVAQHDTSRIRPEIVTVENIAKAQHPDFLTMGGSNSASVLGQIIGIEATCLNPEEVVFEYAKHRYGDTFSSQTTNNYDDQSNIDTIMEWEAKFNRMGIDATDTKGKSFREYLHELLQVYFELGKKYPALEDDAYLASAWILGCLESEQAETLQTYMGVDEYGYNPNLSGRGTGLIANYKRNLETNELIAIQACATKSQAEAIVSADEDVVLKMIVGQELHQKVTNLWEKYEKTA